jgi:hypothetical protein
MSITRLKKWPKSVKPEVVAGPASEPAATEPEQGKEPKEPKEPKKTKGAK